MKLKVSKRTNKQTDIALQIESRQMFEILPYFKNWVAENIENFSLIF